MKTSASYWMFEGGLEAKRPIVEAMKEAKDLGFDAIELAIASTGVLTHEATEAQCRELAATARKIKIEIASLASGESWASNPTSDDPAVRKKITDFTRKGLQVARWLGTDAYLFVPGAVDVFFIPDGPVVPYDVCHKRAKAAVAKLVLTAEKVGVSIGIENVWNKFLMSPLEMRDFVAGFGSKRVKAYFDVGNVLLFGYPEQWIRILGKQIVRVHIKDFKRSVGTAAGFCDLLEGDVDFDAVKKALKSVGYNGYVTAEMIPWQKGRPEKTARAMKSIFR